MDPCRITTAVCACGERAFEVRLLAREGAGLVTCLAGHASFLLDTRDLWNDLIQDRRPRAKKCACGHRWFGVDLVFDVRETGDVRGVDVNLVCAACGKKQRGMELDLHTGGTAERVTHPLDPAPDPWRRIERTSVSCVWTPEDAVEAVSWLGERPEVSLYFSEKSYVPNLGQPLRFAPVTLADAVASARARMDQGSFTLLFSREEIGEIHVDPWEETWKRYPVVSLAGPTRGGHVLRDGRAFTTHGFKVAFASEIVREGRISPQDATLGRELLAWLPTRFARNDKVFKGAFWSPAQLASSEEWLRERFGS